LDVGTVQSLDPAAALARAKQGMQFLAVGSDLRMLTQKAQETLHALRPQQGGQQDAARY